MLLSAYSVEKLEIGGTPKFRETLVQSEIQRPHDNGGPSAAFCVDIAVHEYPLSSARFRCVKTALLLWPRAETEFFNRIGQERAFVNGCLESARAAEMKIHVLPRRDPRNAHSCCSVGGHEPFALLTQSATHGHTAR